LFPAHIEVHTARFSGPIPPPALLREYEAVLPGLAGRIVGTAEEEAKHRRRMERSLLHLSFAGLGLGGLIVLVTIVGGIWLLHEDRNIGGLAALTAALVALVAAFLGRDPKPPADTAEEDKGAK